MSFDSIGLFVPKVPHSLEIIGVPKAGADKIKQNERKINKKVKKIIIKGYVLFNI